MPVGSALSAHWTYFEVRDPETGRIRLETLRKSHALFFARTQFEKTGDAPDIHEVARSAR